MFEPSLTTPVRSCGVGTPNRALPINASLRFTFVLDLTLESNHPLTLGCRSHRLQEVLGAKSVVEDRTARGAAVKIGGRQG